MRRTYFEHKNFHKYTKDQDGVELKNIIDLVLKKDMLHFVQYVKAVKGIGQGLSAHHVVLCKVRLLLLGTWIKRREVVN